MKSLKAADSNFLSVFRRPEFVMVAEAVIGPGPIVGEFIASFRLSILAYF